jgi:hypothetical protein
MFKAIANKAHAHTQRQPEQALMENAKIKNCTSMRPFYTISIGEEKN